MKRDEDSIAIVTAFVVTEGDYFLFFSYILFRFSSNFYHFPLVRKNCRTRIGYRQNARLPSFLFVGRK